MKKTLKAKPIMFPAPVLIVGTYDEEGKPNVMNAAWGGICSSEPPCIQVSIRKSRLTYENIENKKAFTVSFPTEAYAKEADYFGIASGRDVNKFEKTGLTPVKGDQVDAPYVGEFPIALECKVKEIYEVGSHMLVIGEIVNVLADEEILDEKDTISSEKMKPLCYNTMNSDYEVVDKVVAKAFKAGLSV